MRNTQIIIKEQIFFSKTFWVQILALSSTQNNAGHILCAQFICVGLKIESN